MKNRSAFSLAEVLITLGIIGIVASMTIPTVINKGREKETVSKLKKLHSILNQAFMMAVNDKGTPEQWGFVASNSLETDPNKIEADKKGKDNVIKALLPYLKTTSVCYYSDSTCSSNRTYSRTRYSLDGTQFGTWGVPRVILADGSSIDVIYMASSNCSAEIGNSKALKSVCGEIFVDINGVKPPNTTGKDVFWFRITKYGIVPGGTENDTSRDFDNYCNKSKPDKVNGYGCAAWVIYNENMDYLHCNDLSWNGKTKCK